ncbi:OLC1v1013338C1 [Oldenlandia corymbosa var. corymbosa]|uniref:OLC1v1013338C1 n=1 Tax=Oldenlandia corymbosa var. corymbosa TaxID=529605 RepID=A0AAV1E1G9_OLDCO|nr:OLC1v1013338C1 [Oldenlandia corymbosa var. corymbosa]
MVIYSYCLKGELIMALSILRGMLKRGFVPDVVTFITLIDGFFRQEEYGQAQELFGKIFKRKLCVPNVIMCETIIDRLLKAENRKIAMLALDMENIGIKANIIIHNSKINYMCRHKMMDEALAHFRDMIQKGIAANAVAFGSLIHGFLLLGKSDMARIVWKEMVSYGIKPNVPMYNIIMDWVSRDALRENGQEIAVKLFETMVEQGKSPTLISYNSLMYGYSIQGEVREARRIFDSMVAKGIEPHAWSYNTLMGWYFLVSNHEEDLQLFEDMQVKCVTATVSTLNILLQGLFEYDLIDQAKELSKEIGTQADVFTYSVFMKGLCKVEEIDNAMDMLHKLEIKGVEIFTLSRKSWLV